MESLIAKNSEKENTRLFSRTELIQLVLSKFSVSVFSNYCKMLKDLDVLHSFTDVQFTEALKKSDFAQWITDLQIYYSKI